MPSKNRGLCYCESKLLGDGQCANRCSPWADPEHLRLQERNRQANEAYKRREERIFITQEDLRTMRRAVRKFDKVADHMAKRGRRAGMKSHAAGSRR